MNSKLLGGILLIVGTSIGGGMLALPVSTAEIGFSHSIFFLIICWLVMTSGALLLLEVNLRLPPGSNMITMAKNTLGLPGQILAWITYLFLLYTLLSAYISGGSDVFGSLLLKIGFHLPPSATATLYTILFSVVVYAGIKTVDYVNRGLMFGKLGVYILLVIIISPHISAKSWQGGTPWAFPATIMILITSFGYGSIIPSLRDYFDQDVYSLRRAILFGSLIPLLCYIVWDAVIMGVVSREGTQGLLALMHSEHATSGLTDALNQAVKSPWIDGFFRFFTSICMLTAFLAVSLGLFDFIADGIKLKKEGLQGKFILLLTFLPPLIIVIADPGIYLTALNYAGICCVILLLLLPSIMAWRARKLQIENGNSKLLLVPGGNVSILFIAFTSIALLTIAIFY